MANFMTKFSLNDLVYAVVKIPRKTHCPTCGLVTSMGTDYEGHDNVVICNRIQMVTVKHTKQKDLKKGFLSIEYEVSDWDLEEKEIFATRKEAEAKRLHQARWQDTYLASND